MGESKCSFTNFQVYPSITAYCFNKWWCFTQLNFDSQIFSRSETSVCGSSEPWVGSMIHFKPTSSTFMLYSDLLDATADKTILKGETFQTRSAEVSWKLNWIVPRLDWTTNHQMCQWKTSKVLIGSDFRELESVESGVVFSHFLRLADEGQPPETGLRLEVDYYSC